MTLFLSKDINQLSYHFSKTLIPASTPCPPTHVSSIKALRLATPSPFLHPFDTPTPMHIQMMGKAAKSQQQKSSQRT